MDFTLDEWDYNNSTASLVSTSNKNSIVKKTYRNWITYFESPKQILSDDGGEF